MLFRSCVFLVCLLSVSPQCVSCLLSVYPLFGSISVLCFFADFHETVVNLILFSNYELLQLAPLIKLFKLRFKE